MAYLMSNTGVGEEVVKYAFCKAWTGPAGETYRSCAQRATGNGQRATGNVQRARGDGQRRTGNGSRQPENCRPPVIRGTAVRSPSYDVCASCAPRALRY